MGSFNICCSLSGEIISSDTEVVVIPITSKRENSSLGIDAWSFWSPSPILIEGKYNSYGSIDNATIFDSMNSLNINEVNDGEKLLFNYFKNNLKSDRHEKPNTLSNFVGMRVHQEARNLRVSFIEFVLQNIDNCSEKDKALHKKTLKALGFDNINLAKDFYDKYKDDFDIVPVGFVYMKKDKLLKFLNVYGMEFETKNNKDIYAQTIQKQRHGISKKKSLESVDFVSGGDYACANKPSFTWNRLEKDPTNNKDLLDKLYFQHGLDLALLNDYMSLIGKLWIPSLTISEDAKYYGHNEALKMQSMLTSEEKPKNKIKPQ